MREPESWASAWRRRCDVYIDLAHQKIRELEGQLQRPGLLPRTRGRIRRVSEGLTEQRDQLAEHFEALGQRPSSASNSAIPQLLPSGNPPVLKCYENLFRDWSWGAAEAAQSLTLVRRFAPDTLGSLGVYGAGAARLAVDVHTALGPERTVALDLNPFPLLVAARLLRGEAISLPEFPVGPHTDEDVVVRQTLRCISDVGPSFCLAFADALRPPFARGSLDTVLTSWVVDALDASFGQTALSINHVLRAGGTWINVGPLRFDGPLAEAYSIEEVLEIVQARGFEVQKSEHQGLDYFHSPHSGSRRSETVFCFAARKAVDVLEPLTEGVRAAWLLDPNQPVVVGEGASALRRNAVVTIGVLSLVDGKRSLMDIARALAQQWRVPPETLVDPLRELFVQLTPR